MQHHLRNLSMEEKIQGDIIAMRDLNWSIMAILEEELHIKI